MDVELEGTDVPAAIQELVDPGLKDRCRDAWRTVRSLLECERGWHSWLDALESDLKVRGRPDDARAAECVRLSLDTGLWLDVLSRLHLDLPEQFQKTPDQLRCLFPPGTSGRLPQPARHLRSGRVIAAVPGWWESYDILEARDRLRAVDEFAGYLRAVEWRLERAPGTAFRTEKGRNRADRRTRYEYDVALREFLKDNPGATFREMKSELRCGSETLRKLPAYLELAASRSKGRRPKAVSLTPQMLATAETRRDEELDYLIRDQERDDRSFRVGSRERV